MGFDDLLKFVNGLASKIDLEQCLADADDEYLKYKQITSDAAKRAVDTGNLAA